MDFQTLDTMDVSGKTVLLRADLNVPVKDGNVTDTTRIDRVKPTIEALASKGAKIVVMAHFGRPKGEAKPEFSLSFLPPTLEKQWGKPVSFAADCVGEKPEAAIQDMNAGDILLLENVRFYPGEEKNDPAFTQKLAALGDVFVNDAFSATHRAHASTEGLAHLLPCAAGRLMEAELNALASALESPQKPVTAIVGGAKISTKLSVLDNLVRKTDYLILGGGMANTFMHAQGINVGNSLCEKDMAEEAKSIAKTAQENGCKIILPVDQIGVREFKENADHEIVKAGDMKDDQESVDIGPETTVAIQNILKECKTVLWNGPLGVFEMKPFDKGTNEIAKTVAGLTTSGALVSVAGGGDTVAALENAGVAGAFTYISTAGGAFLEWLEGKTLPGVAALMSHSKAA